MGVGEAEIGFYGITGNLLLRHFSQKPDLLTVPERAGGFVADIRTNQFVCKLEGVPVLHHLITISHHTQHTVIAVPHVSFEALDDAASGIEHVFLMDIPIQSRKAQSVLAVRRFGYLHSQTVPRFLPHIHHRLDIGCHF